MKRGIATVAQLGEFDALIDARSPAEYAEDHVPGARSMPVLDNEERIRVGTLYKQVSPFEARKVGAALVARNIAWHVELQLLDKPKHWRPLVYCWRGGQRSGAFTHILREIGWDAHRLEGGYKSWRHHVVEQLANLPARFEFRVVAGVTGSGKSRVLEAVAAQGGQVLHLEELAAHKGSVLGGLPGTAQPSQKMFETRLFSQLARLDPARPVFAESESRRIGAIQLPDALLERLRTAPCLRIDAGLEARVDFLLRDYGYFLEDPQWLAERLQRLVGLQSKETVERWLGMIAAKDFRALVAELLEMHYDPLYRRSHAQNFAADAAVFEAADLSPASVEALARRILERLP